MEKTSILADQIKDTYQSKGVCTKGGGRRSTNKYKKGTKGGFSFSAAGSNLGDGTSGPPMFVFSHIIPPSLS